MSLFLQIILERPVKYKDKNSLKAQIRIPDFYTNVQSRSKLNDLSECGRQ